MSDGNTPLHSAIKNFFDDISPVKILLEHDSSDMNARNAEGETPLLLAVCQRGRHSPELIKLLLQYGPDVEARTPQDGNTALHWLAIGCTSCSYTEFDTASRKVIEILLKHGSDVNAVNSKGETPLHLIVRKINLRDILLIKIFLAHGADVSVKDGKGKNVYEAYCHITGKYKRPRWPTLQMLLIQANERQRYKITPLHLACLFHDFESVDKMLKLGADISATDSFGKTPLYYAVMAPNDDGKDNRCLTSRLMLDNGADINEAPFMDSSICLQLAASTIFDPRELSFKTLLNIFGQHQARLLKLREKQVERGINVDEALSQPDIHTSWPLMTRSPQDKPEHVKKYNDWLSRCSEELRVMSETKIGESRVSFMDLLFASAKELASYARNKELVEAFHAKKAVFPMYRGMLDAILARATERRKLIEKAAVLMSDALEFADPSDEFYERTLSYCSNEHLLRLINGSSNVI